MKRRNLLAGILPLALVACGDFSKTTTNGVTTIKVNTADLSDKAQAIYAASAPVISILSLFPQTVPAATIISAGASLIVEDLQNIAKSSNGAATLTWDASSPPAAVKSLLVDLQQVAADARGVALTGLSTGDQQKATLALSGFQAALGAAQLVLTMASSAPKAQ